MMKETPQIVGNCPTLKKSVSDEEIFITKPVSTYLWTRMCSKIHAWWRGQGIGMRSNGGCNDSVWRVQCISRPSWVHWGGQNPWSTEGSLKIVRLTIYGVPWERDRCQICWCRISVNWRIWKERESSVKGEWQTWAEGTSIDSFSCYIACTHFHE